jgi:translation initiation factor IF-3
LKVKQDKINLPLINEKIKAEKLQVISSEGKNLGILKRQEALELARNANLDLVLMTDNRDDNIPVVKIMDFGKVVYEKKKQAIEAKKNQKIIQIKEIQLRPKIGEHDYQTKINQAIEFLKEGKHVKVNLIFKGREAMYKNKQSDEFFEKINNSFEAAGLTKIVKEKCSNTNLGISCLYYLKK